MHATHNKAGENSKILKGNGTMYFYNDNYPLWLSDLNKEKKNPLGLLPSLFSGVPVPFWNGDKWRWYGKLWHKGKNIFSFKNGDGE